VLAKLLILSGNAFRLSLRESLEFRCLATSCLPFSSEFHITWLWWRGDEQTMEVAGAPRISQWDIDVGNHWGCSYDDPAAVDQGAI